jgi:hypothetical protein
VRNADGYVDGKREISIKQTNRKQINKACKKLPVRIEGNALSLCEVQEADQGEIQVVTH